MPSMVAVIAMVAATSGLAACDGKSGGAAAPAEPSASASAGISGVKPAPEGHAASSTGPSDGATAVGGMAGGEGTGAHPSPPQGNAPTATAGDGAASAASK